MAGKEQQPSLDRAARWDGLLPQIIDGDERRGVASPGELAELVSLVRARRDEIGLGGAAYDVIIEADSTGEFVQLDPAEPGAWEAAGATWWIESWWSIPAGTEGLDEVRRRVQAGPPAGSLR